MKITVLIENTAPEYLKCEYGLSIYIAYNEKCYLLDTGSSDIFMDNAEVLKTKLENVDAAFLSHGHYDHSGGFEAFFEKNKSAKVYLQESSKELCYKNVDGVQKYIGLPKDLLQRYSDRFVYVTKKCQVDDGVWIVPHSTKGLEEYGKRAHMYRKQGEGYVVDDFAHEQSIVIESQKGLIVFNSCSHGGIVNIVDEVHHAFPNEQVYAVVGGFHLKGIHGVDSLSVTEEEVIDIGASLFQRGVSYIYTGHCTGRPAFDILKREFGEKVQYLCTGTTITF